MRLQTTQQGGRRSRPGDRVRVGLWVLMGLLGLAGSPAPTIAADALTPMPRLSAGQQAGFDRWLATPAPDGRINQRRQDAVDLIRHVLETLACAPAVRGEAPGDLSRLKLPGAILNGIPPMALMSGHPASQCLDLTGIDNWSMPGPDTLMLRASFRSPVSGQIGTRQLSIEQGRDRNWRIRQLL